MQPLRIGAIAGVAVLAAAVAATPLARAKEAGRRVEILRSFGGSRLGVQIDNAEGAERGAVVRNVEKDSAAEKAGLAEGDVIVRFDGETVRSAAQLVRLVRETPKGRPVTVEVRRGGATQKLEATLRDGEDGGLLGHFGIDEDSLAIEPPELPVAPEPPKSPKAPKAPRAPRAPRFDFRWDENDFPGSLFLHGSPRKLEIEYQPISGQLAQYFKVPGDGGVLVTSVSEGGPAAKAGMRAGDVILKAGEKPVEEGGDLRRALEDVEPGSEMAIQVLREGRTVELKVTLGGRKREEPAEST